jgi:hypothetical protein
MFAAMEKFDPLEKSSAYGKVYANGKVHAYWKVSTYGKVHAYRKVCALSRVYVSANRRGVGTYVDPFKNCRQGPLLWNVKFENSIFEIRKFKKMWGKHFFS